MPKHVLIVDDEEVIRVLLCRVLTAAGYRVDSARNGEEALDIVQRERADLMILDLMMPVMDGWEVLRRLRSLASPPPVLVVSAYLDRERALREGAAGCLAKPFGLGQLVEACRQVIGNES